jgi:hypothetical protein
MIMCVGVLGFQLFFIFKYLKKSTLSLKSVKSVGKVSNSSTIIISVNEYSWLRCGSHFTFQKSVIYT